MKEVKIKLDGKTFWFNDVEGYLKSLSFNGTVLTAVYSYRKGENFLCYSFSCYGDFYGSFAEVKKCYFGMDIDSELIYLDVTEDEALKFIKID